MGLFDDPNGIDWGMLAGGTATPPVMPRPQLPFLVPGVDTARNTLAPPMDMNMQSPISPEVLAKNAAIRGIPPPPVDLAPTMTAPPSNVGAALTGQTVGAPMDIRPPAQVADAQASTKKPDKEEQGSLAAALKGIKAPTNPEIQKISTPAAPRPTNSIKSGDLIALLQLLNPAPGASGLKLPSTLGQAITR